MAAVDLCFVFAIHSNTLDRKVIRGHLCLMSSLEKRKVTLSAKLLAVALCLNEDSRCVV